MKYMKGVLDYAGVTIEFNIPTTSIIKIGNYQKIL